ncbi:hypothetical protein [Streptomyces sp. NPDC048521]|uniref:hypothetical protein n=1 Tax=Streptomyces sp. NPDC048521 TaxID=3365566 RepID=UPI00372431F8
MDTRAFLVAYEEERAVGCGALRLPEGLEHQARARGLDVVRLDTHAVLTPDPVPRRQRPRQSLVREAAGRRPGPGPSAP